MKKHCLLWFFIAALLASSSQASAQNNHKDVCLKIGGCYFINCKRTIAFGEYSILTVSGNDSTGRMVNFEIYAPSGVLEASLKEGKFTGSQAASFEAKSIKDGFTVTDTRNSRVVLKVVSIYSDENKRDEMNVWGDFFLPNGGRFMFTPETSNLPMLDMMKGSTFRNVGTAIQL